MLREAGALRKNRRREKSRFNGVVYLRSALVWAFVLFQPGYARPVVSVSVAVAADRVSAPFVEVAVAAFLAPDVAFLHSSVAEPFAAE